MPMPMPQRMPSIRCAAGSFRDPHACRVVHSPANPRPGTNFTAKSRPPAVGDGATAGGWYIEYLSAEGAAELLCR